jgi:F-type H+-transporting ATPase subunit b
MSLRRRPRPLLSFALALWVAVGISFGASRVLSASEQEHAGAREPAGGEHDESAAPPPINWWHGVLGERAGREPDLLFRAPGEPAPYLAQLINFGVLAFVLVRFGRKPLVEALAKRKEGLTREIEHAQKLRHEAEQRLQQYEARLEKIGEELERMRREFREQGERDKERIVGEAEERRERMRKDAELLLAQEAKQMQREVLTEMIDEATRLATELLSRRLTLGDHDRFAEAFLAQLGSKGPRASGSSVPVSAVAKGGSS